MLRRGRSLNFNQQLFGKAWFDEKRVVASVARATLVTFLSESRYHNNGWMDSIAQVAHRLDEAGTIHTTGREYEICHDNVWVESAEQGKCCFGARGLANRETVMAQVFNVHLPAVGKSVHDQNPTLPIRLSGITAASLRLMTKGGRPFPCAGPGCPHTQFAERLRGARWLISLSA